MNAITIEPNKPVYLALMDTEGRYDFELEAGQYQTTTGQTLRLPRPAVLKLNLCDPRPGEEIEITKHWTGRAADAPTWTVNISKRTEAERTAAAPASEPRPATPPPTPIRAPQQEPRPQTSQPRLFNRGTGTHGPAPAPVFQLPAASPSRQPPPAQIPANIAIKEILAFIQADPNTKNWSDQARQDLASTVYIASVKAGHIGLWERE